MANRAYLCCSNLERTYPSVGNARYRPEVHTIAASIRAVPVLWLALFQPEDWRTDAVPFDDGVAQGEVAPLAPRTKALARLAQAVERIEKAYPRIGSLAEHEQFFAETLRRSKGRFVTIELDEIAWLASSRRNFYAQVGRAAKYLAGSRIAQPGRTLSAISNVDPQRRLVPPRDLFAQRRPRKADLVACMNVVGTSHIRTVRWEEFAPAREIAPERERVPDRDTQLCEALAEGDVEAVRGLLARGADPNCRCPVGSFTMGYIWWKNLPVSFAEELVAAGFDLAKRRGGYTAMHGAIWADASKLVSELLRLGASPKQEDAFGRTPLALAAHAGAVSCVELFLKAGPAPNEVCKAIHAAEKRLRPSCSELTTAEVGNIHTALGLLRASAATA